MPIQEYFGRELRMGRKNVPSHLNKQGKDHDGVNDQLDFIDFVEEISRLVNTNVIHEAIAEEAPDEEEEEGREIFVGAALNQQHDENNLSCYSAK